VFDVLALCPIGRVSPALYHTLEPWTPNQRGWDEGPGSNGPRGKSRTRADHVVVPAALKGVGSAAGSAPLSAPTTSAVGRPVGWSWVNQPVRSPGARPDACGAFTRKRRY
jgi:hypothetical protein